MLSTLLGFVIGIVGQDAPVKSYGDVLVSGVKVPIVLPEEKSFPQPRFTTSGGNWIEDGDSVYRTGPVSQWRTLAEKLGTPSASAKLSHPLIFKVFLVTDSVATAKVGSLVVPKRSTLTSFQQDDIVQALAIAGGMTRASGFEMPIFDLSIDSSPFLHDGSDPSTFVREIIAPRVNNALFSTDEPVYRGPYYGILVIHAGLGGKISATSHGETPVNVIPYWTCTETGETGDLTETLFANMVSQIATRDPSCMRETSISPAQVKRPILPESSREIIEFAGQPVSTLTPAPTQISAAVESIPKNADLTRRTIGGATYLFARAFGRVHLEQRIADYSEIMIAGQPGDRFIVGKHKQANPAFSEILLGIAGQPSSQAQPDANGSLPISIRPSGDFDAVEIEEGGVKIVRVIHMGHIMRGAVHLTNPLDMTGGGFLSMRVRSKSPEAYSVSFGSEAIISGPRFTDSSGANFQRVSMTGEWQTLVLRLPSTSGTFSLTIQAAEGAGRTTRLSSGPETLDLTDIKIIPNGSPTADNGHGMEEWLAMLNSAQSAAEKRNLAISASKTNAFMLHLNGMAAWAETATIEDLVPLTEIAQSASDLAVQFAVAGLSRIGTPEAHNSILETVRKGPFDLNRLVAFNYVGESIPEVWISHVNLLLTNRDWRVRRQVVPFANRTKSSRAELTLVTSLPDPDPSVRAAIVAELDPSSELSANRMLFVAVNDSSEYVRAAAYSRLLLSGIDRIREEAAKGVRDESPYVRRVIIEHMAENPATEFRSALQTAVLDKNPQVLAAVLDALRRQPGQVVWQEIQSVASSNDPIVHVALLHLAKEKQISIPDGLLGRLRNSTDPEVARLAREIGG